MRNYINNLPRALVKRIRTLPNVSEFYTAKYGVHEYALIYGIEKILRTLKFVKLTGKNSNNRSNKYLEKQFNRLTKYAAEGRINEYNQLMDRILERSIAFRVLGLSKKIKYWHIMTPHKLRRIWWRLSKICETGSSELRFNRVWIDKKPGDYARPLGVPSFEWRAYSWMRLEMIERFLKARGFLATWQHGGRSGVGVKSCYEALIPKMLSENSIMEFDIKGFFDNISHEKIIKTFENNMGKRMKDWISNILSSKPIKYKLPPIEKDLAVENTHRIALDYHEDDLFLYPEEIRQDIEDVEPERTKYEKLIEQIGEYGASFEPTMWDILDEEDLEIMSRNRKAEEYKGAIEGEKIYLERIPYSIRPLELGVYTEREREIGRDSWKNLGQEGKGVPQGLGTSPLLSTYMTDTYLYELGRRGNLLMYMDDGILFAENSKRLEEVRKELEECLANLGLEIEPKKTKILKLDNKWVEDLKFLGLKYLYKENTLMSETRSGTKVKFPVTQGWDDIVRMAAINNLSVPYMRKKYDRLINTQAFETGLKYGFLGCLIAGSQYKDALPMWQRKSEIRAGQDKAWTHISESTEGFIWKSQDLDSHLETLTNISSIATCRMMKLRNRRKNFLKFGPRRPANRMRRILRIIDSLKDTRS